MRMNRRNIIKFGCSSIAAPVLLAACGGGDDEQNLEIDEPDIVTSPGEHNLAHTPEPEEFDPSQIFLDAPGFIRAQVFFGDTPQASAKVTIYDADLKVLHEGLTGEDGYLQTQEISKRLMFAMAETPQGQLYGYAYAEEGELSQAININIYQTLAAHLAKAFDFEYNIVNYLLQRHFHIGYNDNIQSIDSENIYFSQKMMADAYLKSGLSLENYLSNMAALIVEKKDIEYEAETQFKPATKTEFAPATDIRLATAAAFLPAVDDATKYQIIEFALDKAEGVIKNFITLPYSSQVIGFLFSKLKGELIPPVPDPLDEVKNKLDQVSQKLDDLLDYLKKSRIDSDWAKFLDVWDRFGTERVNYKQAKNQFSAEDTLKNVLSLIESRRTDVLSANKWFFGARGKDKDKTFLYSYCELMQEKEFHTADIQEKINDYVSRFLLQQTETIGFIMTAITLDAQKQQLSEKEAAGRCEVYILSLKKTQELSRKFIESTPVLPRRIVIHKSSKTLWVGACNSVEFAVDHLKKGHWTRRWRYIGIAQHPRSSANGFENKKHMLWDEKNPNGVSMDVIAFAEWRPPTVAEVEKVFLQRGPDEAKKKDALDVWAMKRNIPIDFKLKQYDAYQKKEKNEFSTIVTSYFNDEAKSDGFCFYSKFVQLSDYKQYTAGMVTKYVPEDALFPYFPVASKTQQQLEIYYPAYAYNKFYDEVASKMEI